VVFGELAPKTVAIVHAEQTALAVAWPMKVFRFLFYPLIALMNSSANLFVPLGRDSARAGGQRRRTAKRSCA
jgi:CBS domain containing-hemolysin-like protein